MSIYQREIDILVLELSNKVATQILRNLRVTNRGQASSHEDEDAEIRANLTSLQSNLSAIDSDDRLARMEGYATVVSNYLKTNYSASDIQNMIARGLNAFAQTHPDQSGYHRIAREVLVRDSMRDRLFGRTVMLTNKKNQRLSPLALAAENQRLEAENQRLSALALAVAETDVEVGGGKLGGNSNADSKQGGVIDEYEQRVGTYIPTGFPRVAEIKRTNPVPCMFETKVTNGDRGYWDWRCKRTRVPGAQQCELRRVEDKRVSIVPMKCLSDYVNVVRSVDVDKYTAVDTETGQSVVREVITPNIQRLNAPIKVTSAGPAIPYEMLKRVGEATGEVEPRLPPRPENYDLIGRQFGGKNGGFEATPAMRGSAVNAGTANAGTASAGAVHMPSQSEVRKHQFTLTDQDLGDIESPTADGYMQQPESWKTLPALTDPNKIQFYIADDYGSVRNYALQNGFNFNFKHLPFGHGEQESYLEYLVSLDYKMRAQFPVEHTHVFDPIFSTIATVESYILSTLGKLEAMGKFFDRADLFEGAGPYKSLMHQYLRVYAFAPKSDIWYSPLSARYTRIPDSSAVEEYRPAEAAAFDAMSQFYETVISIAGSGATNITDEDKNALILPLRFKSLDDVIAEGSMGILEDETLAMLARLQYVLGYAINSNSTTGSLATIVAQLQTLSIRKYVSRELSKYLDAFAIENSEGEFFHRLPKLRMRQARQEGIVLPQNSIISELDKKFNLGSKPVTVSRSKYSKSSSKSKKSKSSASKKKRASR